MRSLFFFNIIVSALIVIATCLWTTPAWASIQIQLYDIDYKNCPSTLVQGAITSASSMTANCFLVTGKAKNTSDRKTGSQASP